MIKYSIEYQHMPSGHDRPIDDGEILGASFSQDEGSALIPNVGDYVHIDNSTDGGQRSMFSGKVASRLFSYIRLSDDEIHCHVNIVVADTSDNWGALIKE